MGVIDEAITAFEDVTNEWASGQAAQDEQTRRALVEGFPWLEIIRVDSFVKRDRSRLHRQLHHTGHQMIRRGAEDVTVELIEDVQRQRRFLGTGDELLAPAAKDGFVMAPLGLEEVLV